MMCTAVRRRAAREPQSFGSSKTKLLYLPFQVENIFTSKASSAVLTQDLLDIQRLENDLGMEVEAVDDNIFHWKVSGRRRSAEIVCSPEENAG